MNRRTKYKLIITVLSVFVNATLFVACDDEDDDNKARVLYGPEITIGDGKGKSFISLDENGNPNSIGLVFSEASLRNLPHDGHGTAYLLRLPKEKELLPYDHISFDWAPHGHEPAPIYNKAHFDVHFYLIDESARNQIVPGDAMELLPEPRFLPPTYISNPNEGIPQMGKHWVDVTSSELQGAPFKTTFIYGSFNGEVVFHEPMIAHDFLLSKTDTTINIAQPAEFKKSGLYPQKYSIEFDQTKKEYSITLLDLVAR